MTDEYLRALRVLWTDAAPRFDGARVLWSASCLCQQDARTTKGGPIYSIEVGRFRVRKSLLQPRSSNPAGQPIQNQSGVLMQGRAGFIEGVWARQQIKDVGFQLGCPAPRILAQARCEVSGCGNRVYPLMPESGKRPRHGHRRGDQ